MIKKCPGQHALALLVTPPEIKALARPVDGAGRLCWSELAYPHRWFFASLTADCASIQRTALAHPCPDTPPQSHGNKAVLRKALMRRRKEAAALEGELYKWEEEVTELVPPEQRAATGRWLRERFGLKPPW